MALRKVSMNVEPEDLERAGRLGTMLGKFANRTIVFRRAVHLLYWAFVEKEAVELVLKKNGRTIGHLTWTDNSMKETRLHE